MKATYMLNVITTDPLLIRHIRDAKEKGFFNLLGDTNGEPTYNGFDYTMNDVEKEMHLSTAFSLNAPFNNNVKCLETLEDDYKDTQIRLTTSWDDGYFAVFCNGSWVEVE